MMNGVNTNTYISVAMVIAIIGGVWTLRGGINNVEIGMTQQKAAVELQNEKLLNMITLQKAETALSNEKVLSRMAKLEDMTLRDRWDYTEQYRWTTKLQQMNPTMSIPEPERPR